jgi:hypothetical protein
MGNAVTLGVAKIIVGGTTTQAQILNNKRMSIIFHSSMAVILYPSTTAMSPASHCKLYLVPQMA